MTAPAYSSPINEIVDSLDETYTLTYISQSDRLDETSLRQVLDGDCDALYDSFDDAWHPPQSDYAYELAAEAVDAWLGAHGEPDDFDRDDAIYEAAIVIRDRDTVNPLRDCIRNTPCPLLRVPVIGEDDECSTWSGNPPAHYLRMAGLPVTSINVEIMRDLINDTPSELHVGWALCRADTLTLADTMDDLDAVVTIPDPLIILGNPFTGGYWHGQFIGHTLTVRRGDLRLDDGRMGWSVRDVYGRDRIGETTATITPTPRIGGK